MKKVTALAVYALLLCGCWNGRVLYLFEQPFWASLGDDTRSRIALVRSSIPRGYFPRFVVAGPPVAPLERLTREMSTGKFRTAVIGPLLSFEWRSFASRFPQSRFVLIDGARADELPQNAVLLRYDRVFAFRDAGFAAGMSVRNEAPGAAPAALGPRIGSLISQASDLSGAEIDAFSAGVAEALDGARPALHSFPVPADSGAVKDALLRMRREGVEIFLLGMGSLDPWGLEVMRDSGGCAVVAGWQASGAFPSQVFLSVEEDLPQGIARALANAGSGTREVTGAVRLVPGKARPVPETVRARASGG